MRGTDPVQRRDVIQIELMPFRVCLNLTLLDLSPIRRSLMQPSILVPYHPLNEGFEALESKSKYGCLCCCCLFQLCFSDEFWLVAVWVLGLCVDELHVRAIGL